MIGTFQIHRCDRNNGNGSDGVAVIVKNHHAHIFQRILVANVEITAINLQLLGEQIRVVVVYNKISLILLRRVLSKIKEIFLPVDNTPTIAAGDINA